MDFMIDHFLFDTMTDQGITIYKDYFDSFPPKDTIREQMKASIESSFASVFEYISHDKANKELTLIDIFTEKKYLVLDRRFEIVREIEGSLFLVTRLLKIPEIDFYMHSGGIKHPILGLDTKTILKQYWKANKRQDFENHPKRRLDFLLTL